jgi:hypothetical protein
MLDKTLGGVIPKLEMNSTLSSLTSSFDKLDDKLDRITKHIGQLSFPS